jgi:NAD(P)H-dependent FMN reductase
MGRNLTVLLGSARLGRQSPGPARYLRQRLTALLGLAPGWLDLAEYRFPVMEQRMDELAELPPGLGEFSARLGEADGILIVAPEYKGGYPGVLKNALDYLPPRIFWRKPVGICTVSSGDLGGSNCLAQLRLVCLALGGVPIPTSLPVSRVQEAFEPNGSLRDQELAGKATTFLQELAWYTQALADQRRATAPAPA